MKPIDLKGPAPVAVSERLPEASRKVLAYYVNKLGMGRTICAIWVPAKSRTDDGDLDDDDFLEYDEEANEYYWPEGWYEAIENWDDLGYVKVNEGEIVYWQPLPDWHATVLPPSAGEGRGEAAPIPDDVREALAELERREKALSDFRRLRRELIDKPEPTEAW